MIIIKIGGAVSMNLKAIIGDVVKLKEPVIIVHGANEHRDDLLNKFGIDKEVITSISGYSSVLSSREIVETMMMSYSGLLNKRIVELCQQNGVNAIGLSGLDGALIRGKRNRGIRTVINGKKKIMRDQSGKPIDINFELLDLLMQNGYTPVITMPILDENSIAINSENDDVVAKLAAHYLPHTIFQLIAERGLYLDIKDPETYIAHLSFEELEVLENRLEGRIKRKLRSIKQLLSNQGTRVIITDGRTDNPLDAHRGTVIDL